MSDRRDAALVLAMASWVEKQMKAVKKRAMERIDVELPEESLHASVTVDGERVAVAKSTRVQARPRLKAVEPVRFAEWVQQRWPEHIVPAVAEAWLAELERRMVEHPQGVLVDADGEICMWVELDQPEPYTRTVLARTADEHLAPMLSGQSISSLVAFVENEPVELDQEVTP